MANFESRVSKIYMAEFDLTTDTVDVTTSLTRDVLDTTTFGDAARTYIAGNHANKMSWAGLYEDTATTGSEAAITTLRDKAQPQVITVWHVDTTVGSRGYGTDQGWMRDPQVTSRVGDLITIGADLELSKMDQLKSSYPKTTITATTDGTGIDDSASSSSGGTWYYHVFAWSASGGNEQWQVILQDSANGSSYGSISGEVVDIGAVGSARRTFTGTLRRYVRTRIILDASSGSITLATSYVRG